MQNLIRKHEMNNKPLDHLYVNDNYTTDIILVVYNRSNKNKISSFGYLNSVTQK